MPKSPSLTLGSFLLQKKPPDPSPPKTKKGKKRQLSISPNSSLLAPSKKLSDSQHYTMLNLDQTPPPHPFDALSPTEFPPLPHQPYSSDPTESSLNSAKITAITVFLPSLSRMDSESELLETGNVEINLDSLPTMDEVEELLRDDGLSGPPSPSDSSPTAAVKAAIDAKLAEEMQSEISLFDSTTNTNANAKTNANPLPPAPKPVPLFPNGLPPFKKPGVAGERSGAFLQKSNAKTYADKASTPPRKRELVDNILFVFSSQVTKAPLSEGEWGLVDSFLIGKLAARDPTKPVVIRIANSGYDSAHRCGFIACRDSTSENWCKTVIRMMGGGNPAVKSFRAWSKGEIPEYQLCRLFFPSRFDSLTEDQLIPLLKRHNPSLQRGSLTLQNSDDVQGGRAIFIEFDPESYSYIKSKKYRLEFLMRDIDCQAYSPPVKKASSSQLVPGVTRISQASAAGAPLPAVSSAKPSKASSLDPRLNKSKDSNSGAKSTSVSSLPSGLPGGTLPDVAKTNKKRDRHFSSGTDASKRQDTAASTSTINPNTEV